MNPKREKPRRLFVNPLAVWTHFALKTGEAMLDSAQAAVARKAAPAPRVAVIPTADAPRKARGSKKARGKPRAKRRAKR